MLKVERTHEQDAIRIEGVLFPLVAFELGPYELGSAPTTLNFTVDFSSDSHTSKHAFVVQIDKLETQGALLSFQTTICTDAIAEREERPDLSKVDKAKFLRNLAFFAKAKTIPVSEGISAGAILIIRRGTRRNEREAGQQAHT